MKYKVGERVSVLELGGDNKPIGSGIILGINEEAKSYKLKYSQHNSHENKIIEVAESRLFSNDDLIKAILKK